MAVELRVLTYNVHACVGMDGRLDVERVADVVRRTGADLVGFQEVDRHRREATAYEDQVGRLAAALDMDAAYGVALEAPPTDASGGEPRQYGVAVCSRHPITDRETHELDHDPDTERRVLLETRVEVDGTSLTFATTHFGLTESVRERQAEGVVDVLGPDPERGLLVGDLNAEPGSRPLDVLTGPFEDGAAAGGGEAPTFPTPYVRRAEGGNHLEVYEPDRRIDYVLHTPDVRIEDASVVESLASDHSAVLADVRLP